jgi:midasin (ATPase involved in ribosome maturation)
MTSLCSDPPVHSSVGGLAPIRYARPGSLAGMHAIGRIFGQNNPGTDAGKRERLIRSVFKEEQVHAINR